MNLSLRSRATSIAVAYGIFASLWIYFSDRALSALVADPERIILWSVYKGIAFVAVTTVLLFILMRRAFGAIESGYGSLKKARKDERRAANERTEANAAVVREKLFSETVLQSLPGVMYLYDAEGRFRRWNQNFLDVTGYTAEDLAGMNPTDFFVGEERERVLARIAEVFETGESSVEARFVARNGETLPYYFTGRRVEFDGSPCLIGMGIDISKRVRAEADLRRLNERLEIEVAERTEELRSALVQAESADRLKSAFLASMSHELRTPLNSIIGFTGIVLQELPGPLNEEQAKQLSMVRVSARHLLALINDVLDLSKIEAGQLQVRPETCDLTNLIEKAVATVAPLAAEKGLDTAVYSPAGITVTSDPRRISQILLNLLSNAVKFTERGGISVTVSAVTDGSGSKRMGHQGGYRIAVSDTGHGIAENDLGALFLPFRQLDTGLGRRHEGTGLGLAICRRLARLLGGEVEVISALGEGSTFTLVLPVENLSTPGGDAAKVSATIPGTSLG